MKLQYITTREGLEKAFAELWTIPKLCLDTETTGLDARVHDVRLIQLCSTQADLEERVIYVIDCFKCLNLDGLKSLIESREMILGHNLNFDLQFLLQMDIDYKHKIFDTFIAERCLVAGSKEKKTSPKNNKIAINAEK